MELNDDHDDFFEDRLRQLARTSVPADPTGAWKDGILATALSRKAKLAPPRWLVMAWAAAWTISALLSWQLSAKGPSKTPRDATAGETGPIALPSEYQRFVAQQLDLL